MRLLIHETIGKVPNNYPIFKLCSQIGLSFVNVHWVKNRRFTQHTLTPTKKEKEKWSSLSSIQLEAMKRNIPFIFSLMLWLKNLLTKGRPWHWIPRRQYQRRLIHASDVEEYRPVTFAVEPQTIPVFSSRQWGMNKIISVRVSFVRRFD